MARPLPVFDSLRTTAAGPRPQHVRVYENGRFLYASFDYGRDMVLDIRAHERADLLEYWLAWARERLSTVERRTHTLADPRARQTLEDWLKPMPPERTETPTAEILPHHLLGEADQEEEYVDRSETPTIEIYPLQPDRTERPTRPIRPPRDASEPSAERHEPAPPSEPKRPSGVHDAIFLTSIDSTRRMTLEEFLVG